MSKFPFAVNLADKCYFDWRDDDLCGILTWTCFPNSLLTWNDLGTFHSGYNQPRIFIRHERPHIHWESLLLLWFSCRVWRILSAWWGISPTSCTPSFQHQYECVLRAHPELQPSETTRPLAALHCTTKKEFRCVDFHINVNNTAA